MRFLFVTGGSPATVFALTPLATAARGAGHDVVMAANEDLMPSITSVGIPAVSVTALPIRHFIWTDRAGNTVSVPADVSDGMLHMGRSFARMGLAALDATLELAGDWRPDVVVGGAMSYAAPLVAARIGVPYVRHAWDTISTATVDPGAEEELLPELRKLGLDGLPDPDVFLDTCPPSLASPPTPFTRRMRWIPGNRQRELARWMYVRGDRRHRALVTAGTRSFMPQHIEFLRGLTDALSRLDTEVLIAASEDAADRLRAELGDVRAGWLPLDVVAPTCDVILHHGGGVTALTAMNAGVPQLITPKGAYLVAASRRVADFGAAITLESETDGPDVTAEETAKSCLDILSDPSYAISAAVLAAEIAAQPLPADVVRQLEALAAG
ncbi:MAG TPA: nucleotide disphospho-sugar-binding domain-containing protein [Pseudonocardiaceae bacterium]